MTKDETLPRGRHLGPRHLVAPVAARRCRELHRSQPVGRVGQVACGACWERAIRDDERAVVEFGVGRELERDPDLVDDLAVELACAGHRVRLTRGERRVAVARLLATTDLPVEGIVTRLHTARTAIVADLAALAGTDVGGAADDEAVA